MYLTTKFTKIVIVHIQALMKISYTFVKELINIKHGVN
jgi:hypothetical protein